MAQKDDLGRRGELIAAEFLDRAGIAVLDRNWRCPLGEIDIVARDGDALVVVEVKTRSGTGFGDPLEAVTPVKLARLRRLAGAWRQAHPDERGALRVDVIGVLLPRAGGRTVSHVVGAFR